MDFYTKNPKFRFFTTNKPTFHFKFQHESQFNVIIRTGSYNVFHFYAKLLIQRDRIKTFLYYAAPELIFEKRFGLFDKKASLELCISTKFDFCSALLTLKWALIYRKKNRI